MKVGKIVLQSGSEAEFRRRWLDECRPTLADYLNLMFGKDTYRAAQGSFGVQIIHGAAEKLKATVEIYPRDAAQQAESPVAGLTVSQGFDPSRIMDDDDDDDQSDDDNWQDMMKLWE